MNPYDQKTLDHLLKNSSRNIVAMFLHDIVFMADEDFIFENGLTEDDFEIYLKKELGLS